MRRNNVLFLRKKYADGQVTYVFSVGESYQGKWKHGEFHNLMVFKHGLGEKV